MRPWREVRGWWMRPEINGRAWLVQRKLTTGEAPCGADHDDPFYATRPCHNCKAIR